MKEILKICVAILVIAYACYGLLMLVKPTVEAATITKIESVAPNENATDFEICAQVLDECAQCGILDAKGIDACRWAFHCKSIVACIDLISECEQEENFYDTVGSGDAYHTYKKVLKKWTIQNY